MLQQQIKTQNIRQSNLMEIVNEATPLQTQSSALGC